MTKPEIMEKIGDLLADILDEDEIKLKDETVADEVDGWDSVTHVKLILAIEDFYGIRFESDEIAAPENVGALADLIGKKLAEK